MTEISSTQTEKKDRRELVFAFVAPLGVDRELVEDCLRTALCSADYSVEKVHVSEQLEEFATAPPTNDYLFRKKRLMDAGDNMRQRWNEESLSKRGDAVARAVLSQIREMREQVNLAGRTDIPEDPKEREEFTAVVGNAPRRNVAYLVDSLKHPDELQLFRRVYGPAFVSIGVYAPPEKRLAFLLKKQGVDESVTAAVKLANDLIHRDETGEDENGKKIPFGQNVSDAFHVTDFIVDATKEAHEIVWQLTRLVSLVFGDPHKTPSLDEMGMSLARNIQVRSGSLARQVGASILRKDGSVIAVGTNEAARPISGGQYWFKDDHKYEGRDLVYREIDTSDNFRVEMLADILDRLDRTGALDQRLSTYRPDNPLDQAKAEALRKERLESLFFTEGGALRKARFRDNIDYVRAVHAEAAAIIDAARHGVAVKKSTMFTTTFPCHECARHIVAAGIREVVYLEPYPKSAVNKLYNDSIQVDPVHRNRDKVTFRTFVGVSPARYLEFFTAARERKDTHGKRSEFDLREEEPHLPYYTPSPIAAISNEFLELIEFLKFLGSKRHANQYPAEGAPA